MSWWLIIVLQTLQSAPDAGKFDLAESAKPIILTVMPRCDEDAARDEIVVCGQSRDRYRLPLPRERARSTNRARSDAQTGMAALTSTGRCGIFAGERRCDKREAADYGYGKGRDPITVLAHLASKMADADAE